MSILLRCFSIFLMVMYFVVIFHLLKKKRFAFKYSLLWLACGLVMSILVIFPEILMGIAKLLGIEVPSNGLFAMCIFFIILMLISLTVIASGLTQQMKQLIQKHALIEKRLRELEESSKENECGDQ